MSSAATGPATNPAPMSAAAMMMTAFERMAEPPPARRRIAAEPAFEATPLDSRCRAAGAWSGGQRRSPGRALRSAHHRLACLPPDLVPDRLLRAELRSRDQQPDDRWLLLGPRSCVADRGGGRRRVASLRPAMEHGSSSEVAAKCLLMGPHPRMLVQQSTSRVSRCQGSAG